MKKINWQPTFTADMMTPIAVYNAALEELAAANKLSKRARSFALGRLNKARADVKRILDTKAGKQPAPRYEPLAPCTINGVPCFVAAVGGKHCEPDLYAVNERGYVMQFLMRHTSASSALYDAYMMHLRSERQHDIEAAGIAGGMSYAARINRIHENYGEYW
jgi:hypothetical protein